MSAIILNGTALAEELRHEIRAEAQAFCQRTGIEPKLVAILVGNDPASQIYVRSKQRACQQTGIAGERLHLPADTSQDELLRCIERLNTNATVHGILVQLPLPAHIREAEVLDAICVSKDVDAFRAETAGLLLQGRPGFLPCTPHGIQVLLHRHHLPVAGRHVVIVGRSNIVGKPLAALLMQRSSYLGDSAANATVTVCHSRTSNLAELTRLADVLVAAVGKARFVTADMVKPGAIVVDVGSNQTDKGFVGDVDFDRVRHVAGHLTPVPGGVGPLTVTMLLRNTLTAAEQLTIHG